MTTHTRYPTLSADGYLRDLFRAKAVCDGGVVYRKIRDIDRFAGRARFLKEVERRGFQAVINGGHVVIFCNRDPIRRVR